MLTKFCIFTLLKLPADIYKFSYGVMVAQGSLEPLVVVQIHVRKLTHTFKHLNKWN